jgi:peptide/nickel transport system substrate-binding protein
MHTARRRMTAAIPTRGRQGAGGRPLVNDAAQRKAIYEKLTKAALNDLPIIYLYHRRLLIAHTTKLEGYKQMPDGLVRVIGLKLK